MQSTQFTLTKISRSLIGLSSLGAVAAFGATVLVSSDAAAYPHRGGGHVVAPSARGHVVVYAPVRTSVVRGPVVYGSGRHYTGGWYGGGAGVGWRVVGPRRVWVYRPTTYGVYLNPYWGNYTYYPDYSVYVAPSATYQVFYPPATPAVATPASLTMRVPANADIWVQGTHIESSGEMRQFESPALNAGTQYAYDVQARWVNADGTTTERARSVPVHAGDRVNVDLLTE